MRDREEDLVEACIVGTHVHQMLIFAESGEGDADCSSQAGLDVETLKRPDETCRELHEDILNFLDEVLPSAPE